MASEVSTFVDLIGRDRPVKRPDFWGAPPVSWEKSILTDLLAHFANSESSHSFRFDDKIVG